MAALEERLFASGLPVAALMEKAALAVSRRLLVGEGLAPAAIVAGQGVLVLVGPGHNGADGLVIARELHLAGVSVRIWCPFERLKPLNEAHRRHALWLGIPQLEYRPEPGDPDLWIDALFGIGQSRPPAEPLETLLEERQSIRPQMVMAVDGPTGLCADSGRLLGRGGATAQRTWSIGLLKRGFIQDTALARVGQLERIDLGLPPSLLSSLAAPTPLALAETDGASAPWPRADPAAGKYARGRLLVVAGSRRYRGAAHLALAGASASGCGSLRAALPQELADSLWTLHPEVVLVAELGATKAGGLDLVPLAALDLERLDAILLGPGLGSLDSGEAPVGGIQGLPGPLDDAGGELLGGPEAESWCRLQAFSGLLVLDADGLNRLSRLNAQATSGSSPSQGLGQYGGACAWLRQRRGPTWITPHGAELARLFPQLVGMDPLEAAAEAARSSGAAVLLKGARTVVAAADGRRWQLLAAAPQAARAGLGDVLAGYAAGRGAAALACRRNQQERAGGDGAALLDGPLPEASLLDASLLAAVALAHAQAGLHCLERWGPGGVSPQAVAADLRRR
jgi:NAD(P)H-hydrate epimerase